MNTDSALSRLFRILHHRSLTVSVIAVFFAFLASGLLIGTREEPDADWLLAGYIIAIVGFTVCCVALINLLRDERSGYEGFHLSVATLLWAMACVPISLLFLMVMRQVINAYLG